MVPKPKAQTFSIQLTPEDWKRVQKAAKSSHQTVKEWIESMCHAATRD